MSALLVLSGVCGVAAGSSLPHRWRVASATASGARPWPRLTYQYRPGSLAVASRAPLRSRFRVPDDVNHKQLADSKT